MNIKKFTLGIVATVALIALPYAPSMAAEYDSVILGGFDGGTNIVPANTFTNIAAITNESVLRYAGVSRYSDFVFSLLWTPMNGASNSINVAWEVSTGTNRPAALTGGTNYCRGWFITVGADATNAAGIVCWETNITVGGFGQWWPVAITNSANVVLSNFMMKATFKPRRNG